MESLCAQVLRGRYFPDGNFLSAGCPKSASRTWKAMLQGRLMLKEGLVRRVGDGHTMEVWHDKWISPTPSMQPLCRLNDEPIQLVADLFAEGTFDWDSERVKAMFIPSDADAILSMPRPRTEIPDFWALEWEKSGVFSARSV